MTPVQKIAIEKATSFLKAAGLMYAIIDSDGKKHGDLEVITKKKRGPLKYAPNAVRNYYINFVKGMKKDECITIPFGEFDGVDLQSNLAAWATHNWGKGSCSTSVDRQTRTLIVFRLA